MSYKFNPFTKKMDYYETGGGVDLVDNLKLVVNAAVNKLDVLTKSGGAAPDSTNFFTTSIPDGTGLVARTRKAAYLSGTSQFILADATAYWGIVTGSDKIKLHTYDIWDGTGMVHALSRFAGFLNVPTTTTPGDDDFFLLEDGSTYTRDAAHFCICTGHVWANYTTGNTPDWTFYDASTSAELAPVVEWNPKSDYRYTKTFATSISQGSDIVTDSRISIVVKQSGNYIVSGQAFGYADNTATSVQAYIKTGSSTYSSAVQQCFGHGVCVGVCTYVTAPITPITVYLNSGDTIHLGVGVYGFGTRHLGGDNLNGKGATFLTMHRLS